MMAEWDNQPPVPPLQPSNRFTEANGTHESATTVAGGVNGALYVKVMTDEQLEVLRTQIAVYASICEQLVEMHKSVTAQQDLAGVRLGNLYCDPLVTSVGHKITSRQRWTPTPLQLQILESIFDQGTGTPSKQKIKDITTQLSQHGQISETNVYNWFQNRRARSKRKQLNSSSNNAESEVETDADSPKENKRNLENSQPQHDSAAAAEDYGYHGQEISSEIHSIDPQSSKVEPMFPSDGSVKPMFPSDGSVRPMFPSDGSVKPSQSLGGHLNFYESMMENSMNAGIDQFTGKMELPGTYNPYQPNKDYTA